MGADAAAGRARVVAYVPDLMDRSRLTGIEGLVFVPSPTDLAAVDADVAVVDLSRPGVLDALGAVRAVRVIGFGSHVDRELLDAARAAGCHDVMPRSAFFAQARRLLG